MDGALAGDGLAATFGFSAAFGEAATLGALAGAEAGALVFCAGDAGRGLGAGASRSASFWPG